MKAESPPYLSLVVAARNDDHGGNLLGRMQAFTDAWISLSNRHGLSSELIVVEWNPPGDRPPLAEALRWPADLGLCTVRFIEVPPAIHRRYRHADNLPLYQMIAKNVGIRRARGRFVLATNIDIIFSDELVQYLGERQLQTGRMYRIDRHDVMSEIPINGCVDEQLAYCRGHLLRINSREGTFRLTRTGLRAVEVEDVAAPDSGVNFGHGWFAVERDSPNEVFRWVENDAEIIAEPPADPPPPLLLDLEPGPGVNHRPFLLQVLEGEGTVCAKAVISRRATVEIRLPPDGELVRRFRLRATDGGSPAPGDPRILNFRVFRCAWSTSSSAARTPAGYQLRVGVAPISQKPVGVDSVVLRKALRFYMDAGGLLRGIVAAARYYVRSKKLAVKVGVGEDIFDWRGGFRPGTGWHVLEHYLGETFRWVDKDAQLIVRAPRGGPRKLLLQIEPGPGVDYRPFELVVCDDKGTIVSSAMVSQLQTVELPIPWKSGERQVLFLTLQGGDRAISNDPRILNFRVFWCGWSPTGTASQLEPGADADEARGIHFEPADVNRLEPGDDHEAVTPVFLHTNGCGDFTLMARKHWLDLRGYPEFDLFSMNLDSVLCYAAHHAGFREEILRDPMRIYHIEHATGSGWTPEGQARLFAHLALKGVGYLDYQELVGWAAHMRRLNCPMIFNLENWGLAEFELEERVLTSSAGAGASG